MRLCMKRDENHWSLGCYTAGARLGHVVCSTLFDAGICTVGQATRTKASGYWENKAWFSQLGNPWGENYYLLDGGIFVLRLFVSSVSV